MMLHMLVTLLILSVKWANVIDNDDDDDKMAADSSMMEQRTRAYAWLISDNGVRIIFVSGAKNNNNVTQSDNGVCGKRHKNTQLIQIPLRVIMLFVLGGQRRAAGTVVEVGSGPGSVIYHYYR